MGRPSIERCAYIITPGTPLEPPEYCGEEADWLSERCPLHEEQDTSDEDYENYREANRF